ncbi:ankyrin repeats (3 copies) domain-containing protein [Trichoderma breve]|uniref:Ankyrin repeats (3 copies) domain-containing protein n=1 Tax=Trichoderma breve TaxID=2034170 RepID=A0A9W9E6F6_9HYPO|nr:ankyrin repeats (3 copies) domain-containing protein [Trichoderma breve]KAJ4859190.1 ankyrin repeats (3 copies) domain-containing protein [Trichoderma breve]
MASKPLSYNDYIVGWICALSEERTAATAMLDERHDSLPISNSSDTNSYTLGAIGKHNVVVVCLPEGEIGTNSAASVIMQLVTTFPSIKFGLLVGIGGGIPPRVRLGDIVVSTPVGEYPGVVQWDLGKATGTGFVRTGSLDRPPKALLSALTTMKTNHEMEGNKISQLLEELARKWPRLASKYTWNDRLKDAAFEEENADDKRSPGDPRIHYGLIASGNQVIKDGSMRDEINARLCGQVLCVEMEAAGVMNNFPCLVIRGICDYADSKKNDHWQGYAASIAAALTKELLQIVRPTQIEGEPSAKDFLSQVHQSVSHIQLKVDEQEEKQILDWLTPIDYGSLHSDCYKRLQPGTGEWFLGQKEFQDWITGSNNTLFCHGIPGAGKTILASLVISHLSSKFRGISDIGITYVYFNYNKQEDQDFQKLLASLLKQLAGGLHPFPESTKELYHEHSKKRTRASLVELETDLRCVMTKYSEVFIILDALDECQFFELNLFLSALFELQKEHRIRILTTSRPIPEVMDRLNNLNIIKLQIRAETSDVTKYIEAHIDRLPKVARESPILRDEIKADISEAVDGMFLLAQIYVVLLQDKITVNDIRRQLVIFKSRNTENSGDQKGKMLAYAYEQAIERIRNQKEGFRSLAMRALAWVTLAKRQITTLELQHALATQSGMTTLSQDDLPDLTDITSACVGLLTVDEESRIIRLVHYTTHEYLEQTRNSWFPGAEESILRSCLTYLSFEIFKSGHCRSDEGFEHRIGSFPLFHYAANHWECHLSHNTEVIDEVLHLLECQTSVEASLQARLVLKQHPLHQNYSQEFPSNMTGLHAAAVLGLTEATKLLLERGYSPDAIDSYNYTPLSLASIYGHEAVAELLVVAGADLEIKDLKYKRTPLMWASARGYEAMVKLLLEKASDVNAQDCVGRTPLSLAANFQDKRIIKLLLQRGSDVDIYQLIEGGTDLNARTYANRTILSHAAELGRQNVIQLLIETGKVDLNEADGETGLTPLHYAVISGHLSIVELLANAGAQLEIKEKENRMTALGLAIHHKQKDVFDFLLKRDANIHIPDRDGRTSLYNAAIWGELAIIRQLVDKGVDINARTSDGQTALFAVIGLEDFDAVRLLVELGADINAREESGRTPLHYASIVGNIDIIEVVRLLVQFGADIDTRGSDSVTPLMSSILLRHSDNIQSLIDLGADANARDKRGRSALFYAIHDDDAPVVELLVGMDDVDINRPDAEGTTPIMLAMRLESHEIIKILLQSGKLTNYGS